MVVLWFLQLKIPGVDGLLFKHIQKCCWGKGPQLSFKN